MTDDAVKLARSCLSPYFGSPAQAEAQLPPDARATLARAVLAQHVELEKLRAMVDMHTRILEARNRVHDEINADRDHLRAGLEEALDAFEENASLLTDGIRREAERKIAELRRKLLSP